MPGAPRGVPGGLVTDVSRDDVDVDAVLRLELLTRAGTEVAVDLALGEAHVELELLHRLHAVAGVHADGVAADLVAHRAQQLLHEGDGVSRGTDVEVRREEVAEVGLGRRGRLRGGVVLVGQILHRLDVVEHDLDRGSFGVEAAHLACLHDVDAGFVELDALSIVECDSEGSGVGEEVDELVLEFLAIHGCLCLKVR